MIKLLLFTAGARRYGLPLERVRSIEKPDALLPPEPGRGGAGGITLDGRRIPLRDLPLLMGGPPAPRETGEGKMVLVDLEDRTLALRVDQVDGVATVADDRITPLPDLLGERSRACFPRVLKGEDGPVLLIDPEGVEGLSPPPLPSPCTDPPGPAAGEPKDGEIPWGGRLSPLLEAGRGEEPGPARSYGPAERRETGEMDPAVRDLENGLLGRLSTAEGAERVDRLIRRLAREAAGQSLSRLKRSLRGRGLGEEEP